MYTIIIIAFTIVVSLIGFSNETMFNKNAFIPSRIYENNEWYRFFTAGFLHADFMHLFFNMFVLYSFGTNLEIYYGEIFGSSGKLVFFLLYVTAIGVAHITTYIRNRHNSYYRSIGASGAVAAILFANIFLVPNGHVSVYGIHMNSLLFGVLYLGIEYYFSRRGGDNINHDAHFLGALYGFLFILVFKPSFFMHFIEQVQGMLPF